MPKGREPYGIGASVVVGGRESLPHPNSSPLGKKMTGEGKQVNQISRMTRKGVLPMSHKFLEIVERWS